MPPHPIDRRALVTRHDVELTQIDPRSPLGVGTGSLAITVDATGLQTFPEAYPVSPREDDRPDGTLLGTLSTWGWHSHPEAADHDWRDALVEYDSPRGPVPYVDMSENPPAGSEGADGAGAERDRVLRGNPHRLDLGRIGLQRGGRWVPAADVRPVSQRLSLWEGVIRSDCEIDGRAVRTWTLADPERDVLAFRVRSADLAEGLTIGLAFPYGGADWHSAQDWDGPQRHRTRCTAQGEGRWRIDRVLDATRYTVLLATAGEVTVTGDHEIRVAAREEEELDLVVEFLPGTPEDRDDGTAALPSVEEVRARSAAHWQEFWEAGAALDLSAADDPRAAELERRVVLSQFLTAIHCAGDMPPQETGLVCPSWRGKAHLEMHWWHAAHFPLWGRPALLRRSLDWYRSILPNAREMAARQGFAGARWPKQVGPEGEESPSPIATFLIWQQPHLIHLAELLRRAEGEAVVPELDDLVTETAEFMASFALPTERGAELGPPLIPAQESYGALRRDVWNPTFELVQWHWALAIACAWKERQGAEVPTRWAQVRDALRAPLPREGVYPAIAVAPYTIREDHPSMLGALGVLPSTDRIDPAVMRATLEDVLADWDWDSTWGWDYPMMAMTAARLGETDLAVDLLLTPEGKNEVLPSGHTRQTGSLPVYLPGNGGLLAAVALMAGGWDDAAEGPCPGLPAAWQARAEGFVRSP